MDLPKLPCWWRLPPTHGLTGPVLEMVFVSHQLYDFTVSSYCTSPFMIAITST